ncbi:MAG: hypothetical protein ACRDOI_38295 [Trebonia sp.]
MYLSNIPPWFCFIVHPRQVSDLDQIGGASLIRRYSKDEEEFVRKACSSPPLVLGEVTTRGSSIRGEVIGAVRMPETMLTREGLRAVVEAADLAVQRGTSVIGLGALTAPVTGGGLFLLPRIPAGVTVTNGNALTAAMARENVMEAAALRALANPRIAVLGATGSVGVAASHLLADEGLDLILIGRSAAPVRQRLGDLEHAAALTDDMAMVGDADIVLVLTSHPSARLRPHMLKPFATVVDFAQPANVPTREYAEFRNAGISIAEGGIVRIPGYRCTQDFFLETPEETFACLAETYLLASTGLRDNSVGYPSPDFARTMSSLAAQHGIHPRPLGAALVG